MEKREIENEMEIDEHYMREKNFQLSKEKYLEMLDKTSKFRCRRRITRDKNCV